MKRLLLATALFLPATALAERPLTYDEALKGALANNPQLTSSQLSLSEAEASLISARGIFDPSLSATGTWAQFTRVAFDPLNYKNSGTNLNGDLGVNGQMLSGTRYSLGASVTRSNSLTQYDLIPDNEADAWQRSFRGSITQNILKGHRLSYNLQQVTRARNSMTIAELSLEKTRQDTLAQAASAYWTWVYQVELAEIAHESVEVAEEALRIGMLRVETGELAEVEKTRLEAALVQARINALEAEQGADQAADSLLLLMGELPGQELLPATEVGEVPVLTIDRAKAVEVALAQNLDLAVARANADAAVVDMRNAKHGTLPELSVTASANLGASENLVPPQGADPGWQPEWAPTSNLSFSGNLSVPLGNRAARGESKRAAAAARGRQLSVEELERSVASQTALQVDKLSSAREKMELADVNLRLAEATLAAEEAKAEAGRAIQKDVLEARTDVERKKADAAKARTDYRIAQTELLKLQGQLE
ncbi:MAG: TolC family protein [Deltaproteobacteria bacterium]|nr:MAG: TolC family protein [Deltaproteobacteria bacterium]